MSEYEFKKENGKIKIFKEGKELGYKDRVEITDENGKIIWKNFPFHNIHRIRKQDTLREANRLLYHLLLDAPK